MKRLLTTIVTCFAFMAQPVLAQKWTVGQQPTEFPTNGGPEILGDGSTNGGIPPAQELVADIPSNFDIKPWMANGCSEINYTNSPCHGEEQPANSSFGEFSKFRTHCVAAKAGWFDFILYPGQKNVGHPHLFFGNTSVTPDSTYESLRKNGTSTCGGGPINRSAYWIPCLMLGPNKCLKPDLQVVYYNVPTEDHLKVAPFARGFAMIGGADPLDFKNTFMDGVLAAANAKSGGVYRYADAQYNPNPIGGHDTGFGGWSCETANDSDPSTWNLGPGAIVNGYAQPALKNAQGQRTLKCPAGVRYIQSINFPSCWDGKNLTSPNGRRHVIYPLVNNNNAQTYCPNGWYRIPKFEQKTYYDLKDSDFDGDLLYLSSDRMDPNPSKWFLPGSTGHSDWFGAWDYPVMKAWMAQCNGITINGVPGHNRSCIDTQLGDGRAGKVGEPAPDGSTGAKPQVNLNTRWINTGPYRWFPITRPLGPSVMDTHHH